MLVGLSAWGEEHSTKGSQKVRTLLNKTKVVGGDSPPLRSYMLITLLFIFVGTLNFLCSHHATGNALEAHIPRNLWLLFFRESKNIFRTLTEQPSLDRGWEIPEFFANLAILERLVFKNSVVNLCPESSVTHGQSYFHVLCPQPQLRNWRKVWDANVLCATWRNTWGLYANRTSHAR